MHGICRNENLIKKYFCNLLNLSEKYSCLTKMIFPLKKKDWNTVTVWNRYVHDKKDNSNFWTDFSKVCEQSTDFHFPDLEQQFAIIEQELALANEHRHQHKHSEDADKVSLKSSSSTSSEVRVTLTLRWLLMSTSKSFEIKFYNNTIIHVYWYQTT